jgi:hypothetical protein
MAAFDSKSDWEQYWYGPEFSRFRAQNQSLFQVPLLYTWADVVVEGALDDEAAGTTAAIGQHAQQ